MNLSEKGCRGDWVADQTLTLSPPPVPFRGGSQLRVLHCSQVQIETDIPVCSQGMWIYPNPVYKDWAVAPWPIILYSPLCLSHKEIYTNGLFQRACFTYTEAAWVCHCVQLSAQCKVCSYCDLKVNRDSWKANYRAICLSSMLIETILLF